MTYTPWTGRTFGVEMEMSERGMSASRLQHALVTALPRNRVSHRTAGYYHSDGTTWDVKTDSSAGTTEMVSGYEVASPALLMDESGHSDEFKKGVNAIAALRPHITKRSGVHVHIDVADYSWDDLRKLMVLWVRYEPFFFELVSPSRRNNGYCMPSRKCDWTGPETDDWNNVSQAVEATSQRRFEQYARMTDRGALNLGHFWRSKRVEFRLHHGTVDYDKLRHWVILLLALVNRVKQANMPRIERGRYVEKPLTTQYIAKVLGLAPTKWVPEVNPAAPAIVHYLESRRQYFASQRAAVAAGRSVQRGSVARTSYPAGGILSLR